jgi:hypothetical protein
MSKEKIVAVLLPLTLLGFLVFLALGVWALVNALQTTGVDGVKYAIVAAIFLGTASRFKISFTWSRPPRNRK